MEVMLQIPDDIAIHLTQAGGNLSRRALEGFALEELKSGRISEVQVRRMLGLERMELDGFLKAHGVHHDCTVEEIEQQVDRLKRSGI
jgi:hypothetical protein